MLDSIEKALLDLKAGKMVIVVDDENRENEGDFIMPAETITPEAVNFMATYGKGLICTPLSKEYALRLELDPMVQKHTTGIETAFTISVDALSGVSTGISARDRAKTIEVLASPFSKPSELARPGHIFPLIAKDGGVLEREGHTEAAVDLARLAGFTPVGVICEILSEDGSCARLPELRIMADKFNLTLTSIELLQKYRMQLEEGKKYESSL
jgi:3,4-dihydroxy 2-butanone 4-phosphate synthase/GTP cyclohydrolase II